MVGTRTFLSMCSVAYGGESVMSYDLEQFYRNLSTGGGTYKIKTGRNKYEEKVIDPRCLVCWYRGGMTSNTIAAGEESLREDFKGCKRGAQVPDISMGTLMYSITRTQPNQHHISSILTIGLTMLSLQFGWDMPKVCS